MKYEFSLILSDGEFSEADADKLFETGCDDASVLTRGEVTVVQFDRQAQTLDKALGSAIRDAENAGFKVARVEIAMKHRR